MELKEEVESLLESYHRWLKESTKIDEIDEANRVATLTTPHLDRHNDFLQIVVKRIDSGYELSDDGYILADLEASGCLIDSPKRESMLIEMLQGFGILNEREALVVRTSKSDFPLKKHSLVQAMLAINDMFYVSSPQIRSFFHEDVQTWLRGMKIRCVSGSQFVGKSGYSHKFDFVIPESEDAPERILRTINKPNKQTTMNFIMTWQDMKIVRPRRSMHS